MPKLRPLFTPHVPSFGLDISSECVFGALFERHGKTPALKAAFEAEMPASIIENGVIKDAEGLTTIIRKALLDAKRSHLPKYVVASLPDEQCYVLTVTLASGDASAIDEAIRWEVTQHVPFAVDELFLDWAKIDEKDGRATYQVAAAPKPLVDAYADVLQGAGCVPIGFNVATVASLQALALPPEPFIVLSIGWKVTTLLLFTNGGIPLSFTTGIFSGEHINALLADRLKLKANEAERAKQVCGLDISCSQGVVRHALWPEFKALLSEIERIRMFLSELSTQQEPTSLLLTGAYCSMKSLDEELRLKTRLTIKKTSLIPCSIPSPRDKPLIRDQDIPRYITALGLALHHP